MRLLKWCLLCTVLTVAGCATDKQFLDSKQSAAVQTAENRARFEMACQEAARTVLSRTVVQPPSWLPDTEASIAPNSPSWARLKRSTMSNAGSICAARPVD